MVTHSSILAWRIPWTKEPGGLQSTGSQIVRHDWATNFHFQPEARYNKGFKIPPQLNQNLTLDNFLTHFFPLHLPHVHSQASLVAQIVKNPPANAGIMGSTPGLGRSPGEKNGNPLQYFCLGNPMDRGTWRATFQSMGLQRVGYDWATKQQKPGVTLSSSFFHMPVPSANSVSPTFQPWHISPPWSTPPLSFHWTLF